ncbi:MAG: hypothetical protein Q9170_003814 [Blastenia crenularia]
MSMFQNLRESIGSYWSPGPSKPSKGTTRLPSLEEVKSRLDRDSVSPSKRTSEWLRTHSVDIKTPKALGVKGSKVTKSTPSKKQSAKAKAKIWDRLLPKFLSKTSSQPDDDDLEGATLVGEDPFSTTPGFENDTTIVEANVSHNADLVNPALTAAENEDTVYQPTAQDVEIMKNWSKEEVWLFYRLNNRGFEPLLPQTWDFDFETVPDKLFDGDDAKVLIKPREGNTYNASHALRKLFEVGGRVRDRIACHLRPEETLRRELLAYYKWSIKDAGLNRIDHIPILAIGTAAHNESIPSVIGRVTDALHDLGRQYCGHFFDHFDPATEKAVYKRDLPTLYGIVITYSVATIVTYDSRFPGKAVQSMGSYNFAKTAQDVWHAFALAILMVKARDYLVELNEEEGLGNVLADDTDVDV